MPATSECCFASHVCLSCWTTISPMIVEKKRKEKKRKEKKRKEKKRKEKKRKEKTTKDYTFRRQFNAP